MDHNMLAYITYTLLMDIQKLDKIWFFCFLLTDISTCFEALFSELSKSLSTG